MLKSIKNFVTNEDGVSAIEYGLIAALVAVAIYVAIKALGVNLASTFSTVSTDLGTK